jgi:hypothetical protein
MSLYDRAMRSAFAAIGLGASVLAAAAPADADCGDSARVVWLTGGIALAAGATGALVASGVIVAADDSRDYDFGVGAGVGIGVTAGLSVLYVGIDLGTDCAMARDSAVIVWSVPIVTLVVGSLLPIAIWGAADDVEAPPEEPPPTGAAWFHF